MEVKGKDKESFIEDRKDERTKYKLLNKVK